MFHTRLPCILLKSARSFLGRYFFTRCRASIPPRTIEIWLHSRDRRSISFCLNQRHGAGLTFVLCANDDLIVRFPMLPTRIRRVYRFKSPTQAERPFSESFLVNGYQC